MTKKISSTALTALASAGLLSALIVGCSSSSSSSSTTTDSGTPVSDTGAPTKDTGASDTGITKDTGTATDAPTGDAGTLYTRLGGHAGIRSAVNAVVTAELQNADIASYFFFQTNAVAGHPTKDQIEECFTDFVGGAAGGPEQYPTTITTDAGSYTCRSLTASHSALKINTGTFTTFLTIAAGVLTSAGVSSADITTLAGALTGTESQIVTDGDGGVQAFPGDAGATATDAATGG